MKECIAFLWIPQIRGLDDCQCTGAGVQLADASCAKLQFALSRFTCTHEI